MFPTLRKIQGVRFVGGLAVALTLTSIAAAQSAKYGQSISVQGFSQPSRESNVASIASGIVLNVHAREGQRVKKGECLVELDDSVHQKRLELARIAMESTGELQSAQAELNAKISRLGRLQELATRNHATVSELVQAEEELAIARAGLQRAEDRALQQEADYRRLESEAESYRVKAPFDGVVVRIEKEVGEYVGPGEPVVATVANLDVLTVDFLLPRTHRERIQQGQEVNVLFTVLRRQVIGVVTFVSPFPKGETNTYSVKVRVENTDGELSAGERCLLPDLDTLGDTRNLQANKPLLPTDIAGE